jgi:hypothetical protein
VTIFSFACFLLVVRLLDSPDRVVCQQKKPDSKSWRGKIKSASTERHASTKYFCLWKSFRENPRMHFFFNRSRKLLSSGENITVARVVQDQPSAISRQLKPTQHRRGGTLCILNVLSWRSLLLEAFDFLRPQF